MDRRRLLLALPLLAAPLLLWGALRLMAPGGTREGEARPLPQAASAVTTPEQAVPLPPDVPADVRELLRQGRNWRAARRLREILRPDANPELLLTAARAEAGWGGWANVRELLEGKPWLDAAGGGLGWYLLGQAREETGQWPAAADAYARYLRLASRRADESGRVVAELRHARAMLRAGQVDAGVAGLERVGGQAPEVAAWTGLLAAEAVAQRGDTGRVRALLAPRAAAELPGRAQRAHVAAHRAARDLPGARAAALAYLARAATPQERAEMAAVAARVALDLGERETARRELRAAAEAAPEVAAAVDAARWLSELPGLGPADHLAIATVYERHNNAGRAAGGYRAWLASGAGTPAERHTVRLRLGKLLFAAGRYGEAEEALRSLLAEAPPPVAAEAALYAGRAQYRRGSRAAALSSLLAAADRFRGQPAAGEALYLAADLTDDAGADARATALYRRVASEYPGSAPAGLALMRLAGAAFLARDHAGAARAWEEYRTTNPQGPLWLQASYWAGRAHAERGDAATARARWREVRAREPLSYYSVMSARRLGERYWPISFAQAPHLPAEAARRVAGWMRGVDLLLAAGLVDEARQEVDRRIREAGTDPGLLYPLAEALPERGYAPQGIRIGLALRGAGAAYDPRLVRILYPFPYRELVAAEARERGLDPFLVAALIRQESSFLAHAHSRAGAMGLMQVMPATGAGLAAGAGIRGWERDLLYNPEINVHLGTRFLAAQVRRFGSDPTSVFIAYNAGPGRVARWRSFPEARDRELFIERIPFEETRDYVKILTRNSEIYRGLYGG